MTVRKNSVATLISAVLLAGSVLGGLPAQAQQHERGAPGNHMGGGGNFNNHRPAMPPRRPDVRPNVRPPNVRPEVRRDFRPGPDFRPGHYRPGGGGGHLRRWLTGAVLIGPGLSIMIGNPLPSYGSYPIYPVDNWSAYNLPMPCCGQYWVQYGSSYLLMSPNGVVLQAFTP